jgi:hypothetical protein
MKEESSVTFFFCQHYDILGQKMWLGTCDNVASSDSVLMETLCAGNTSFRRFGFCFCFCFLGRAWLCSPGCPGIPYEAHIVLKLEILLSQPPECWDYWNARMNYYYLQV